MTRENEHKDGGNAANKGRAAPARRFIAPNGRTVTQPLREAPTTRDTPETVELIGSATRIIDEPECMSRAIVDAQADLAKTYDRLRHLANVEAAQRDRQNLSIEHRMADAHRRARMRHINIGREMDVMRRDLERARRGGQSDPSSVLGRLERVEAKLDHRPDLDED